MNETITTELASGLLLVENVPAPVLPPLIQLTSSMVRCGHCGAWSSEAQPAFWLGSYETKDGFAARNWTCKCKGNKFECWECSHLAKGCPGCGRHEEYT